MTVGDEDTHMYTEISIIYIINDMLLKVNWNLRIAHNVFCGQEGGKNLPTKEWSVSNIHLYTYTPVVYV